MNTVVWIMVMLGSSGVVTDIVTGPEFTSRDKCERAALTIHKSANEKFMSVVKKPFCVRIEK